MSEIEKQNASSDATTGKGKLFLIDAYALIYRSYYALIRAPRINSKGLNTSAIMGFCNTLNEVLQKEKPTHLAVAFDHGKTFRHEMFKDYKAQREETPEDIKASIPIIKDILTAFNIPILVVDNYEADDVIGTVAHHCDKEGLTVYMLTPDKDYAQLVTDNVFMYKPRHGGGYDIMGPAEVCKKYGITSTSQVIDLLGLMGDSSDNYPGCPGVGEKTAVKLINEFGSIEGLLSHSDQLKGKMRQNVEEHVDDIRLSLDLATIRTDAPMAIDIDAMKVSTPNEERLREIFDDLEFKTFADKFFGGKTTIVKKRTEKQTKVNLQPSLFDGFTDDLQEKQNNDLFSDIETDKTKVNYIETKDVIEAFCSRLEHTEEYAITTKNSDFSPLTAKIEEISLATTEDEVTAIKLPKDEVERTSIMNILRPVLENTKATKIVQDAKQLVEVLHNENINITSSLWDTMIAHYIINPDLHHNKTYTNVEYDAKRAAQLLKSKKELEKTISENGLTKLFHEIEMPLVYVLADMEMTGVRLDTKELNKVAIEMNERVANTEREIYELAGESFNIASPRQVGDILFGKMQLLEKPKKTKTGQFVTSEEILLQLAPKAPIVEKILSHRKMKKLLGTYIEALPKLINKTTGHIHTSFNQCVTATGRLSSSEPNLQNIPIRTEDGKEIRRCFIPEEGEEFYSADYSQVELRIMASLSGDENMIDAFVKGHDIHAATSSKINHKPIEEVTKDERRKAKSANFGIIYGISAFGLAQDLNIERKEAKELIDGYFESFPKVKDFIEESKEKAREKGYAETLFGRRRYLPDINSKNGTVRSFAERNAVNAPIQGTAADIMKIAMIRTYNRIKQEGLKAKLILQVHDELNFSVPTSEKEQLKNIVTEEMQNACNMAVPLIAESGWGKNWLEAH